MTGVQTCALPICTVPVAELQKKLDADAKALRELDTRIQALNWTNELL